jgi:hypothetical protein
VERHPETLTERHNRSQAKEPVQARAETICQNCRSFMDTGQWLEGLRASLYDRHTFLALP